MVNGGFAVMIERYGTLAVDSPSYFPTFWSIIKHARLFINAQEYRLWQEVG